MLQLAGILHGTPQKHELLAEWSASTYFQVVAGAMHPTIHNPWLYIDMLFVLFYSSSHCVHGRTFSIETTTLKRCIVGPAILNGLNLSLVNVMSKLLRYPVYNLHHMKG